MMKKIYISVLILFCFIISYSQDLNNNFKNYEIGVSYLQQRNYHMADSFITMYLNTFNSLNLVSAYIPSVSAPIYDVLFNRGIAKYGLGDVSSACSDFYNASVYNDLNAFNYYCSICTDSIDSIYYDRKFILTTDIKKSRYLRIQYYDNYEKIKKGRILDLWMGKKVESSLLANVHNNIVGFYYIKNQDTIYQKLNEEYMVSFMKWNKDYSSFIETKLNYPEDKKVAYNKYKVDRIFIYYKVLVDKHGKLNNIELQSTTPINVSDIYITEALKALNIASDYIESGNIFGKKVDSEIIFPVSFTINEK